jgi:hypothetical protein
MNMIFNIMKKLDSIINKIPIKPLELKNSNSNSTNRYLFEFIYLP